LLSNTIGQNSTGERPPLSDIAADDLSPRSRVRGKFRAGSRSKAEGGPAGLEITRVDSRRLTLHPRGRGQLPDLGLVVLISALPLVALLPIKNEAFIDDCSYRRDVQNLDRDF
jgi:hypothetical protein